MSQTISIHKPADSVPVIEPAGNACNEFIQPEVIEPASLKSQRSYTCANHPNKSAFCLCVKCGNMLCSDCSVTIVGRRYCTNCVMQDNDLCMAYEREILRPKIFQAAVEIQSVKAPQKITELPTALKNMVSKTTIFFINAKKSPFKLTYPLAFLALVPNAIVSLVFFPDKTFPQTDQYKEVYEKILEMSTVGRIGIACVSTVIQILLLDLIFFACIRFFTNSQMTYKQAGTVLHFCMLPLVFSVFGLVFDMQVISFISVVFMIMLTTTASRASTQSTFFQSFGLMLTFIIMSTLFKLI